MTRLVTITCTLGILTLLGLNIYELGKEHQARIQLESLNCAPIVVYRRGTYSDEELQRMIRFRRKAT